MATKKMEAADYPSFEEFHSALLQKQPDFYEKYSKDRGLAFFTSPDNPLLKLTEKEMDDKKIPSFARGACVHHYEPLRDCREKNKHKTWKCGEERHRIERCYYKLQLTTLDRSTKLYHLELKFKIMDKMIAQKKKEAENE